MKTAILRFGSVLVGAGTLGSLFLAAPAFASYYPSTYQPSYGYQQQQVSSVCTGRFDPNCILEETQELASSYMGYNQNQQYQNQNEYQNPYETNYNSYPSYGNYGYNSYNSYPSYGSYGYPTSNYGYESSYPYEYEATYQTNPYATTPSYSYQYQYQYQYQY